MRRSDRTRLTPRQLVTRLAVAPGRRVRLRDEDAGSCFGWSEEEAKTATQHSRRRLAELEYRLNAEARHGVLIVLQARMAAARTATI